MLDTYAAVYERDIDIAFVMAVRASSAVRAWLCSEVGFPELELLRVRHSWNPDQDRESDIEARFGQPDAAYVIQIENKLDAVFQPGQQAAYADRALSLSEEAEVVEARCILFCPAAYEQAADGSGFDAVLTYEQVLEVLLGEGAWGREIALLIQHAIVKHRRGGTQSPDDPTRTEFFGRFSELAQAAGLPPVPTKPRKRNAGFLWWPRRGTLKQPKNWRPRGAHGALLCAKLIHGWADIELIGVGDVCNLSELAGQLEGAGVEFEVSGSTVRIRERVPVLDPDRSLEGQRPEVDEFVGGLEKQAAWWREAGRSLVEAQLDSHRLDNRSV